MKGWHSATRVQNEKQEQWDAAALGGKIKEVLAKGLTKPETMNDIFSGGM